VNPLFEIRNTTSIHKKEVYCVIETRNIHVYIYILFLNIPDISYNNISDIHDHNVYISSQQHCSKLHVITIFTCVFIQYRGVWKWAMEMVLVLHTFKTITIHLGTLSLLV